MNAVRGLALASGVIGSALLVLVTSPGTAWADAHLMIQGVDVEGQTITIVGTGFTPKDKNRLRVLLGEAPGNDISAQCLTPAPTDTAIVCSFPGGLPNPGDYRLVVSKKNGESLQDRSENTDR